MRAPPPSPSPTSPAPRSPARPVRAWVDGVVVVALLGMVALLAAAGRVPAGDGPHLAATTLETAGALRAGDLAGALSTWFGRVAPQPPLGYLPGVVATLLIGDRWLAMLLVGAFALWLCWDALARLADGAVPWAPALVIVASPLVWLYVEQYGWDLLAAAVVLQCLSWLHRSAGLSAATPAGRRAAATFGLWMGAGVLTKYTVPMFLWLPCALTGAGLLASVVRGGPDRAARLHGLGLALGVFAAVVVPWTAVNADALAAYLGSTVDGGLAAGASESLGIGGAPLVERAHEAARAGDHRFSADALALYPLALKDALGWPGLLVLALVGLSGSFSGGGGAGPPATPPRLVVPGAPTPRAGLSVPVLALAAALGGLLVLSLLTQSQDRYALPAFVALAVLALPLARLPWGQEVFVGVFAAQLVGTIVTFRPGAPVAAPRFDHGLDSVAAMSWPVSRSYRPSHVDLAAWHVDDALAALVPADGTAHDSVALVLPDDPLLPGAGLYLLRARQRDVAAPLRVVRPLPDAPPPEGWPGAETDAAYVVWVPGRDRATDAWVAASGRAPVAAFALPGGARGVVLR